VSTVRDVILHKLLADQSAILREITYYLLFISALMFCMFMLTCNRELHVVSQTVYLKGD
jgi:uncharacterized membrane protein YuzA (DUF378 family)